MGTEAKVSTHDADLPDAAAKDAASTDAASTDAASKDAASTDAASTDEAREDSELSASEETRQLALAIAAAGLDKKASGIEIIDVCGKVDYADMLVLMSGRSDRHVHAIAKGVQEDLKKKQGKVPISVEGLTAATWVLIDFNDVVVHVFQQEARVYYDLEGLWIDANRVSVPQPSSRKGGESHPPSGER